MSENIKKYKVSIFGESFTIVSDESEEHVLTAARLIDEAMRNISQSGHMSDTKRIAVLTALQQASASLLSQQVLERHSEQVEHLLTFLDQRIIEYTQQ